MDYKKHYDLLIAKSKNRILKGYTERHHIVPRCIGGTNDDSNIAVLTPEEHYLAHQLLVKIYPSNSKLLYAARCMARNSRGRNNKLYGWIKRKWRNEMDKNFTGENHPMLGKTHSNEVKKRMSETRRGQGNHFYGKTHSDEIKQKLRECNTGESSPRWGTQHSKDTLEKMSKSWEDRPVITCPYCDKSSKNKSAMLRWHFDNCKSLVCVQP